MTERRATHLIPAAPATIRRLLLDGGHLPHWNPAFLSLDAPSVPKPGAQYLLRVRTGSAGTFEYTAIRPHHVGMRWQIPGLVEDADWELSADGAGTLVTHHVRRTGPLAVVIRHADRDIALLRLQRLRSEVIR